MLRPARTSIAKLFGISFLLLSCLWVVRAQGAGYYNVKFGFKLGTPRLAFTTGSQALYTSLCSSAVTVKTTNSNYVTTNVTSDLTVNLSAPAGMTFYSDPYCTSVITNLTITTGNSAGTFYYTGSNSGSASVNVTATGYIQASQSESFTNNPFVWTGGGGNASWSTAGNWSGGVAPGSSDVAVFNSFCSSNCSPNITANASVGGVRIDTGYAGTITQNTGVTFTAGATGFVQLAGAFVGSSSGDAVTINGSLILAGGSFKATSGVLSVSNDLIASGSPTFNSNGGTLTFTHSCCGAATVSTGTLSFNQVAVSTSNATLNIVGTMTVAGDLTLADTYTAGAGRLNGGTIQVSGNVTDTQYGGGSATISLVGTGTQTVTGGGISNPLPNINFASTGTVNLAGTLSFSGSYAFTYTSGTINAGSSLLDFRGGCGNGTITINGSTNFNNAQFGVNACSGHTFTTSGTLKLAGNLTLANVGGTNGNLTGGTIEVNGDITASAFGNTDGAGSTVIKLVSSGTQTVTSTSSSTLPSLEIAASGTVNLVGTINVGSGSILTYSSGNLNAGTSTVRLLGGCGTASASSLASAVFYNFYVQYSACTGNNYSLSGTITVGNNLILESGTQPINGGTIVAKGNVTINSNGGGSTALTFNGTSAQTLTVSVTNTPSGNITLDNASGLNLASNVTWNSGSQNLNVISGAINMAGYNMTLHGLTLNGNSITRSAGTLIVNGSTVGAGTVSAYGGTINP